MISLETALGSLVDFLLPRKVPYMVIGGVAGLAWGTGRATFDVDVTVWAPDREKDLIRELAHRFQSRVPDPEDFVRPTAVLPLDIDGTHADVVFGRLPYEQRAVRRAREVEWGGRRIQVCSPEDLIVYKIVSDRPKDQDDVRVLIGLKRQELERRYLDPIVRGLATDLAKPEIWNTYEGLMEGP